MSDTQMALVYGIRSRDGSLRIIDQRRTGPSTDQRLTPRGRVCEGFTKADLIDLLWWFDVESLTPPTNMPLTQLRQELAGHFTPQEIAGFSEEELRFAYEWVVVTREEICLALGRALSARGVLREV